MFVFANNVFLWICIHNIFVNILRNLEVAKSWYLFLKHAGLTANFESYFDVISQITQNPNCEASFVLDFQVGLIGTDGKLLTASNRF